MRDNDNLEDLRARLEAKEQEVVFLKDELLKAAHQIERFAERMENQNQISANLLKILSPTELPNIPGFEISSKFVASIKGSEYLEILNFSEKNRFGVLMSHADGPGLSALFLACLLKFSPQIQSSRKWAPKTFVQKLAEELMPHFEADHSASILYGYFDRASSELHFTARGDFGILIRDTSGKIHLASPHHSAINKETQNWDSQDKLPLALDECMVFISPGFLKSMDGEQATAKLNKIIPELEKLDWKDLNQVRNELFVLQKQYAGSDTAKYDASVIVMKNKDRSLKLASV
jgi:sigma-B regulation protein RsbU (phosphoserine phosphatase)